MTDAEQERTKTVHNETTKLTATYTNGLAIAVFAVGGIGPFFSVLFSAAPSRATVLVAGIVCLICQCASLGLHYVACRFLRKLA